MTCPTCNKTVAEHTEPCRDLDALVAEKVMGWTVEQRYCEQDPECGGWEEVQNLYENPEERAKKDSQDWPKSTYEQWLKDAKASWEHIKITRTLQPCYRPASHNPDFWQVIPEYSKDLNAASSPVGEFPSKDYTFDFIRYPDGSCEATIEPRKTELTPGMPPLVISPTPALAITKACLLAKERE